MGITNKVSEEELALLASAPHQEYINYFTSTDFTEVSSVVKPLLDSACNGGPATVSTTPPTTTRECTSSGLQVLIYIVFNSRGKNLNVMREAG